MYIDGLTLILMILAAALGYIGGVDNGRRQGWSAARQARQDVNITRQEWHAKYKDYMDK